MLCVAMVLFHQRLGENWARGRILLWAGDFEDVLDHFSESVIPARRKKRTYIRLSRPEITLEAGQERDGQYEKGRAGQQSETPLPKQMGLWEDD